MVKVTPDELIANAHLLVLSAVLGLGVNVASLMVISHHSGTMLKAVGTARNAGLVLICAVFLDEAVTFNGICGYALSLLGFAVFSSG